MFGNWKQTGVLTVLLILTVFTTGCFGLFAGRTYQLTVTVLDGTDADESAIEGATVAVGNATDETDADGTVTFLELSGTVTIEVTADGFDDPVTRTVTMNQNRSITIRMGVVDVVATAIAADGFTTLVTAIQTAELVEALQADGPFTVFAPTDEAFAAVPEALLAYLLDNPDKLAEVLLYHVVPGRIWAADAIDAAGTSLTTLQGEDIDVTVDGDAVFINEAQVIVPDIGASNGVIHVIDKVLIPPGFEVDDIVDTAIAADDFNTLVAAVIAADLVDALRGDGPLTVFAPTDAAFADLPEETLEALLADPPALANILKYHVVADYYPSSALSDGQTLTTLQGATISISIDNTGVFVGDAEVTATDIKASNGIIHVIDAVLTPPANEI